MAGWCFGRRVHVRSVALLVDGALQEPMQQGMPRSDVLETFEADHPDAHAYRSGFWGLARVAPRAGARECRLALRATLEDGSVIDVELARIATTGLASPAEVVEPQPSEGPFVAICMATYEPTSELFARQIDSIRAQTHPNWVCVISDDCSSPERFADDREGSPATTLRRSRSPARLGFYRNFERAWRWLPAPPGSSRSPTRTTTGTRTSSRRSGPHSGTRSSSTATSRVVDGDGSWSPRPSGASRRNNHTDLALAPDGQTVTGAASLFRRDLLDTALPFPPSQF